MNISYKSLPASSRFARSASKHVHRTTQHGGKTLCGRTTLNMDQVGEQSWNHAMALGCFCTVCHRAFEKSATPAEGSGT